MSAFIVSDETMQAVVEAFVVVERIHGRQSVDPTELGQQLYKMNYDAIHARYPDTIDNSDNVPGPIPPVDPEAFQWRIGRQFTRCAMLKAIRCLLYQCSEGNVPESPLFRQLSDASESLTYEIISELPEWKAAGTWN